MQEITNIPVAFNTMHYSLQVEWSSKVPPAQLLAHYLVFMFAADHLKYFLRCPLVAKQKLQVIVRKLISLSANNVTSS